MARQPSKKTRKRLLGITGIAVLAGLNAPAALGLAGETYHAYTISRPSYQATYGSWTQIDIPRAYRTNAIHAALLHTGKVLIVAGSGNEQKKFDKGSFDTVLWDPKNDTFKK